MDVEVKNKANRRHVGHNLQKIRVYFGMKQEVENIKSLDPLLYSHLTHQKYIRIK